MSVLYVIFLLFRLVNALLTESICDCAITGRMTIFLFSPNCPWTLTVNQMNNKPNWLILHLGHVFISVNWIIVARLDSPQFAASRFASPCLVLPEFALVWLRSFAIVCKWIVHQRNIWFSVLGRWRTERSMGWLNRPINRHWYWTADHNLPEMYQDDDNAPVIWGIFAHSLTHEHGIVRSLRRLVNKYNDRNNNNNNKV